MVENSSIFERIGGNKAVNAAVDLFYEKVLADPSTTDYFKGINMEIQREKQKKFLTYAFGGPNSYTGKDLRIGHSHLNVNNDAFDSVGNHLLDTLAELGVPQDIIDHVNKIVQSTRKDIVYKKKK